MAYDEKLDARVREIVVKWGATTKKMFGGTCHLLQGNMLCGVNTDQLIVAARTSGNPGNEDGITLFVLDAATNGIETESTPTVDSRNFAAISFSDVEGASMIPW